MKTPCWLDKTKFWSNITKQKIELNISQVAKGLDLYRVDKSTKLCMVVA